MRICETCGKHITDGCMTNDDGDFYTHEGDCFVQYMDKTYGEHQWMHIDNSEGAEDGWGGYYLVSEPNEEGFVGTGIYYTEMEEEVSFEMLQERCLDDPDNNPRAVEHIYSKVPINEPDSGRKKYPYILYMIMDDPEDPFLMVRQFDNAKTVLWRGRRSDIQKESWWKFDDVFDPDYEYWIVVQPGREWKEDLEDEE